ncbi:hypothetical protein BHE74_00027465 [Ensete ventricosum]|nr:hypothetical protein BHE74_00027465 [Ensete ventricosum]
MLVCPVGVSYETGEPNRVSYELVGVGFYLRLGCIASNRPSSLLPATTASASPSPPTTASRHRCPLPRLPLPPPATSIPFLFTVAAGHHIPISPAAAVALIVDAPVASSHRPLLSFLGHAQPLLVALVAATQLLPPLLCSSCRPSLPSLFISSSQPSATISLSSSTTTATTPSSAAAPPTHNHLLPPLPRRHPLLAAASFSSLVAIIFSIFPMQATATSAASPHCCLSSLPLSPPAGPHCSPAAAALIGLCCPIAAQPCRCLLCRNSRPPLLSLIVGYCLLPPAPIADAVAVLVLRLLPMAYHRCLLSSVAVAAPSSAAQPPLPSLLPHLPPLLLPCFLLPLLVAVAFLLNRSLTCHIVVSLSPTAALTAANRLCPPLADADNLIVFKSYYIYDICL